MIVYLLILVYIIVQSVTGIEGPNICKENYTETYTVPTHELETYGVPRRKWCLKFPFRCTQVDIGQRNVTKHRIETKIKSVEKCCMGYVLEDEKCVPVCSKQCQNGICISPDTCECDEGYFGKTCDICLKCGSKCPEGSYGPQCEHECQCYNNASCDSQFGNCTCSAGWRDEDCNTPCAKGYFGDNCLERCSKDEIICDHITGQDICRDGYTGNYCDKPCDPGHYGKDCSEVCTCKNDAVCKVENGNCECKPGWKGSDCTQPCEQGKFGVQCQEDCLCSSNNSLCSPIDGLCRCRPGWKGVYCNEKCTYGYYGEHCATPCNCTGGNFVCDHIEGCECPESFVGEMCDVNINDVYEPPTNESIASDNSSFALAIATGILVLIIVVIIIAGGMFYYKIRKNKKEKEDRYHVTYTKSSTNSLPYVPQERSFNGYTQPYIVDNFGTSWHDPTNESTQSATESEPEYSEPVLKNYQADMNNPNISSEQSPSRYLNKNRMSDPNANSLPRIPQDKILNDCQQIINELETNKNEPASVNMQDTTDKTVEQSEPLLKNYHTDLTNRNIKREESPPRYVNMNRISELDESIYEQ